MADEEDLNERVKTALKDKDANAAVELLTDDEAHTISKGNRNQLVALAIKGAYIAPYFPKIVGLVSGDVVKGLAEDLGKHGKPDHIFEVLEDPEHQKHRNTIVTAAILNHSIPIVQLFRLSVNSVSNETKEVLVTALGRDVHVTNAELASILGDSEFTAHRDAIVRHVEARMDAEHLEEFLNEVRSVLPESEIVRLEQSIARKKKYGTEHAAHGNSHDGADANWSNYWALGLVAALVLIIFG